MFVACGLNYKTAPLEIREKIAFANASPELILNQLMDVPAVNEAAVLTTCNRTEIYCETADSAALAPWIANFHHIALDKLLPHFYLHVEHEGIRHALRVASGLDSMMLGEPQILGQMKQAYQVASQTGTIKQNLRQIFQYIFQASKRIRHQSGIGNNPVSVAFAAVQLIGNFFSAYPPLRVFLIGSGETASLVAKYLKQQGVTRFMVASRTREHAQFLAKNIQGEALSISDIPYYLAEADVVISATTCPLPFINKNMVEHALKQKKAPLFFLDLAVPRDIESNVKELDQVQLYNIDDLQMIVDQGMNERRNAAIEAEQLVEQELDNYLRQHRALSAKGVIRDYRNQMQKLAQEELNRALQKLSNGQCQYSVLTEFSERLVKKFTHTPTVGLRHAALDNRNELLELAHYLFNVSTDVTSS